jgi:hypothetical protein
MSRKTRIVFAEEKVKKAFEELKKEKLIYTLKANQIEIISVVLEWLDHKNYERRFKY